MTGITPKFLQQERDFDLLLLEELAFDQQFCDQLQTALGHTPSALTSIRHSVFEHHGGDAWGETDLLAEFASGLTLLIENKLSARFQPDQAQRYRARAAHHRAQGRVAVTVLVAPRGYVLGVDPADWDHLVTYDDLGRFMTPTDARSIWRRSLLTDASIRASKLGNLASNAAARSQAKPELAAFKAAWQAWISQGQLWQANPQSGASDEFLYRPRPNPFGLTIWHHPLAGYLSVQIPKDLSSRVQSHLPLPLPEGFSLTPHPSTIYLDASVSPIDMTSDFAAELENVDHAMTTARRAIDLVETALS